MSILTPRIFSWSKFLAKFFKLLYLIPGAPLFSTSFLEHVHELKVCLQLVFAGYSSPLHHVTPPGAAAAEIFALEPDEAHKRLLV